MEPEAAAEPEAESVLDDRGRRARRRGRDAAPEAERRPRGWSTWAGGPRLERRSGRSTDETDDDAVAAPAPAPEPAPLVHAVDPETDHLAAAAPAQTQASSTSSAPGPSSCRPRRSPRLPSASRSEPAALPDAGREAAAAAAVRRDRASADPGCLSRSGHRSPAGPVTAIRAGSRCPTRRRPACPTRHRTAYPAVPGPAAGASAQAPAMHPPFQSATWPPAPLQPDYGPRRPRPRLLRRPPTRRSTAIPGPGRAACPVVADGRAGEPYLAPAPGAPGYTAPPPAGPPGAPVADDSVLAGAARQRRRSGLGRVDARPAEPSRGGRLGVLQLRPATLGDRAVLPPLRDEPGQLLASFRAPRAAPSSCASAAADGRLPDPHPGSADEEQLEPQGEPDHRREHDDEPAEQLSAPSSRPWMATKMFDRSVRASATTTVGRPA